MIHLNTLEPKEKLRFFSTGRDTQKKKKIITRVILEMGRDYVSASVFPPLIMLVMHTSMHSFLPASQYGAFIGRHSNPIDRTHEDTQE